MSSSLFVTIEIRSVDGAWSPGKFEALKAGDVFRVIDPPDHWSISVIIECEADAVPASEAEALAIARGADPASVNWSVSVRRQIAGTQL
jgi:hypothetical protein